MIIVLGWFSAFLDVLERAISIIIGLLSATLRVHTLSGTSHDLILSHYYLLSTSEPVTVTSPPRKRTPH